MNSPRDCDYKLSKSNYNTSLQNLQTPVTLKVKGQRPRWWYIVVANCRAKIDMTYEIWFTNEGGTFSKQFTKDAQGKQMPRGSKKGLSKTNRSVRDDHRVLCDTVSSLCFVGNHLDCLQEEED